MRFIKIMKTQMDVARYVGYKDYDGAIRVLQASLSNSAIDIPSLELIAHCHRWSSRNDMAISVAQQTLAYDPNNFESMRLLSEIYAERKDHVSAVRFIRLGLENYPEPQPSVPKIYFSLLRLVSAIVPRFRSIHEAAKRDLGDLDNGNRKWFFWAKQYIAWYNSVSGREQDPIVQ